MDLKQGHWRAKGCKIDYILTKINDKYNLFCLQTKNSHVIESNKTRLFTENHVFICDLEKVYLGYFKL